MAGPLLFQNRCHKAAMTWTYWIRNGAKINSLLFSFCYHEAVRLVKVSNLSVKAFVLQCKEMLFIGSFFLHVVGVFRHLHSRTHTHSAEGGVKLKCYPSVCTTVHAHVFGLQVGLRVHYGYVFECLCVGVCTQSKRGGGRGGRREV